jgi:hypothetical protein
MHQEDLHDGEEITRVRHRLDALVVELDRRRHRVINVKRHLRRHARSLAVGGLVVAALAGAATVALARTRPTRQGRLARRGAELRGKARSLGQALGRIADDPDGRAPPRPPVLGASTLVAIGLTAAQILAKRLRRSVRSDLTAGTLASWGNTGREAAATSSGCRSGFTRACRCCTRLNRRHRHIRSLCRHRIVQDPAAQGLLCLR